MFVREKSRKISKPSLVFPIDRQIPVVQRLAKGKKRKKDLGRNHYLAKCLQNFPNEIPISTIDPGVVLRPVYLNVHRRLREGEKSTLLDLTDLFCCVYFSDGEQHNIASELFAFEGDDPAGKYRYGSFGYIDLGIARMDGAPILFITTGQVRKQFWRLPNNVRNRHRGWYDAAHQAVENIAVQSGIEIAVLPGNDLVQEALGGVYQKGHKAPMSMLDQFYDRFAANRGYDLQIKEIRHPINGHALEGLVWVKSLK